MNESTISYERQCSYELHTEKQSERIPSSVGLCQYEVHMEATILKTFVELDG
jgi:hypothetical protein